MKKQIILALVVALSLPLFAQEEVAPKQKRVYDPNEWLPRKGDWSLGFSIDPVTRFLGNAFNGSTDNGLNSMSGSGLGSQGAVKNLGLPLISVMGSYLVTDHCEIRANVGINTSLSTERKYVQDDKATMLDPNNIIQLVDIHKHKDLSATFSVGACYRVGDRRIQGVVGGGLLYGYQGIYNDTYQYANQITEANQNPTTATFAAEPPASYSTTMIPSSRLLEFNRPGSHVLGAYAQLGVECFLAKKFAIGLNVNVLIDYHFSMTQISKFEGFNTYTLQRQELYVYEEPVQSNFDFNTDNIGANIYFAFYF